MKIWTWFMIVVLVLTMGLILPSAASAHDFKGCTPGFWKNHLDAWPAGFLPTDDFDTVLNDQLGVWPPVDVFDPDLTLLEAMNAKGSGINKLARHGAAALLSAAHPDVNYPLSTWGVANYIVQGRADELAFKNELGCPL